LIEITSKLSFKENKVIQKLSEYRDKEDLKVLLGLRNFKGVKEGKLELSTITILLGANNSEKTTILEALFLASNPFRIVPYNLDNSPSMAISIIENLHKTLRSEGFALLFYNYIEKEAEIRCKIRGEEVWLKFIRNNDVIEVKTNKIDIQWYSQII